MRTLYESVLSSTGSGKYKKIDAKYLLKNGFEPDTRYGSPKTMLKYKETGDTLRIERDKIVLDIATEDDVFDIKTLIVSNIEDLDLVIDWFKAYKDETTKMNEKKLRETIFKKLKEL